VLPVAERPHQAAVEEVALADDARELAVFVHDGQMANPPEAHQLLG
jgi:hypothetical protein